MTRIMTVMLLNIAMCSAYASDDVQASNEMRIFILTTVSHLGGDTKPLLSVKDIAHVQQINRAWRKAASDDRVWKMQAAYIFKFNVLPENFYWDSCSETAKRIYLKHSQKAKKLPSPESSQNHEPFYSPIFSLFSSFVSYDQPSLVDHSQPSLILCSLYKAMIEHDVTIKNEITDFAKKRFEKDQSSFINDELNKRLAVAIELFGDSSFVTTSLDTKNHFVVQSVVLGTKDLNRFKDSEMLSKQNLQHLENLGSLVAKRKNKKLN